MDMRSWKKVLLQWITECGFMERNYFNIEQSDIDAFYQNFSSRHQKTSSGKFKHLGDFLKEFYPSFEKNLDDENYLSSVDYIYVYSLFLHFCCVKHPETVFHEICQKLPEYTQQCVASFFNELLDTEPITKEALRHAIAEVANNQSPPPRGSESLLGNSSNSSVGGLSSASFPRCESPLKTPKRSAGPQRISPTTPKSYLLEERTRELYNLRAQLETERYEKGLLEVQIKQNEDKIHKLNNDHRRLLQQITDLKNDIILKPNNGSPNHHDEENQIHKRLLKELSLKEQDLLKLSDLVRTLREEKTLVEEKLNYAEKQIVIGMSRIKELDFKVDELTEELEKKNDTIEYLTNNKLELEQFICDTRTSSSDRQRPDLNASMDALDSSFMRNGVGNNTNSSTSLSSPENLGASVIDIQLREKEHENQILKEELQHVKREHKRLAKQLIKITQDFDKPLESLAQETPEESEQEGEDDEENGDELSVSCEEQFYIFTNCMEKINKFHKTEKNKVKILEEASQSYQQENGELFNKLKGLNEEISELKEKLSTEEKKQEELIKSKKQVDETFEKSQTNLEQIRNEKQELYANLQSLEHEKESLIKQMEEWKTKLELQQKDNQEMTKNIKDLKDIENTTKIQLQDTQQKFSSKTLEFDKEIEKLTEKLAQQIEEIKLYQQTEQTLKTNYEQILIENNALKKESGETDIHIRDLKKDLLDKEQQMSQLAEDIQDFKQKNNKLEENINRLMKEYQEEKLSSDEIKTNQEKRTQELEQQIQKLKADFTKEEHLKESKQQECELQKQNLESTAAKIQDILKLFGEYNKQQDIFHSLKDVENKVHNLISDNKETHTKLASLEVSQLSSCNQIEELQLELNKKMETLKENTNSLNELSAILKKNSEYEEKLEKLKEKHMRFIDKVQQDLDKKDVELQERLQEAATEYENSMERMAHELKLEKEQHNNKEMELLLIIAEHNDIKRKFTEKEQEIIKLKSTNSQLQEHCEKLKLYETKVKECTEENEKLRLEIDSFKQEVTQNALRLIEADKSLNEFMELTKGQDISKMELENLKKSLKDKEITMQELKENLEKSLQQKENTIQELKENLQKSLQENEKTVQELQENLQKSLQQKEISMLELKENLQKSLQQKENTIQELKENLQKSQKDRDSTNHALEENLKKCVQEKDSIIHELEENLQKSQKEKAFSNQELKEKIANYEEHIEKLQQEIQEKTEDVIVLQEKLDRLSSDKSKLLEDSTMKTEQIRKEQQDKISLLNSLEKSTDKLKMSTTENEKQKLALGQKFTELKEQFDSLTLQNTKLQADFVEREGELLQSQEDQQQEKVEYQQKLSQLMQNLSEKSEQLESLDMALMEVLALMENNFNLSEEIEYKDLKNLFNFLEDQDNCVNIQKLRKNLNILLFSQEKLKQELKDLCRKNEETSSAAELLKKTNTDLQLKLKRQEKHLREYQESEEIIMEKRVSQEVKRLEEDLANLEQVNERLAQENVKIQVTLGDVQDEFNKSKISLLKLEEEKLQLKEEIRSKSLTLEKLQREEKRIHLLLKEKSQFAEKASEKSKQFENQCKEKSLKLQNLEKDYQDLKDKSQKSQQKLTHYQTQHQVQQTEQKKLQEKLHSLQTSNESLETDLSNRNKELLTVKNKNSEISQQLRDVEQQLHLTSKKIDEILSNKLNAETQCEQLISESQQLKRDLDFLKSQQQSQQEDNARLNQEIESLKQDKLQIREELRETKLTLQKSNDNVSQLIQQISSIRLEKEAALADTQLLRKQLEETGKNQSSSETKLKSIIEKSQDFERKLLTTENELKSLKVQLDKSETNSEKLLTENKKLRDAQEASNKRIERFALKLGDSQAKCSKLERDNDKLSKTLEANSATVEALQKEKDLLQSEAKSLKERLSRTERAHEQLVTKVQNLEKLNNNLQELKQKLEASEIDSKIKLNKLEKMRDIHEDKLRKLTASLNNAEHSNVKLNLEIGAINSELQEIKIEHHHEQLHQVDELKEKLVQTCDLNHKYEEINEKLKIEVHQLKEENSTLNDQLSKVSLSLDITKQKCEKFALEMEQIRADMLIIRQEKSQVELQHETSIQKLSQFESNNTKLIYERKNLVKSLEHRINSLEEELAAKTKEVDELQKELETIKINSEVHNTSLTELEQLRSKLSVADETIAKEEQIITQLRFDNQILHTKYEESKKRAQDAANRSEERIKENRLELEGKLEKMKTKMKTLYADEITKMKTKEDREMAVIKSEMDVLKTQNMKYEEHTRKLSQQIVRLNDKILEHQKENAMLSTKLKHIMEQHKESESFKRPSSIHISTVSSSTAPVAAATNNIGTNLAMEDEEGEIFNNTYLTDLKNGCTNELMSRGVCLEELQHRNSLYPPHLRSSYTAQFDHEFPEEDLKDGPHSLDDSMSALLSTTAGGTRKKCTGVTHYKRPGPPTPSKHGGRLSFGGISEPGREILKESFDSNAAVSSSKTPARFNFFASRFSMGNTRDENSPPNPKRRLSSMFKRK